MFMVFIYWKNAWTGDSNKGMSSYRNLPVSLFYFIFIYLFCGGHLILKVLLEVCLSFIFWVISLV